MKFMIPIIYLVMYAFLNGCREGMPVFNTHHPQLEIQHVIEDSKPALLLTTSKATDGPTFKVSNDRCTLMIECTTLVNTFSKKYCYEVPNIAPEADGGFHGLWLIDDSLVSCHKFSASACISDTTGQYSCDTIRVSPNEI